MPDKLTPPPCPECGTDARDSDLGEGPEVHRGGIMGQERFHVFCRTCDADGPVKDSRVEAVFAWDAM